MISGMNPKTLAVRWFEHVWNRRDPNVIKELLHANASAISQGGRIEGPDSFLEKMYKPLIAGLPDLRVAIDGVIAEGDDAVVRWTVTGTHDGELLGVGATGKRLSFSGMTWLHFKDGQIVEGWDQWNLNALHTLLSTGSESATVMLV